MILFSDFRWVLLAVQDASYHLTRKGHADQSKGQTMSVVPFTHRGLTRLESHYFSFLFKNLQMRGAAIAIGPNTCRERA